MKTILLISLFLSFGCQAIEKPKERCFMVESMSLGCVYCREISWSAMNYATLKDCKTFDGMEVKNIYGADNIYNICEEKHVESR